MPANQFLPFATGSGSAANLDTQAEYAARTELAKGFASGIAPRKGFNKVWRQAAFMAAALGEYLLAQLGVDILDDGDLTAMHNKITAAVQAQINATPSTSPFSAAFATAEIVLADYTDTAGAHGLGGIPTLVQAVLRCKTAEYGYAVGEEIQIPMQWGLLYFAAGQGATRAPRGILVSAGAVNLHVVTEAVADISIMRRDAGNVGAQIEITPANWRVVARAWR